MWTTNHHGLSGKARRVRQRSRAARMQSQQDLAEYMEAEDCSTTRGGSARLGHRSEFLPSLSSLSVDESRAGQSSRQLLFKLTPSHDRTDGAEENDSKRARKEVERLRTGEARVGTEESGAASATKCAATSATIFPPVRSCRRNSPEEGHIPIIHLSQLIMGEDAPFAWSGFLRGCALGGAIAAALLFALLMLF